MTRVCGLCKVEKPLDDFYNAKNKKLGKAYRCKPCTKKTSSQWYKNNNDAAKKSFQEYYLRTKETRLELAAIWRKNNADTKREYNRKRKAKIKGSRTIAYSEKDVLALYGTKCHICKKEIDMEAPRHTAKKGWEFSFHIDHVVPISKGGPDSIDNVRPSHAKCNLAKSDNMLK